MLYVEIGVVLNDIPSLDEVPGGYNKNRLKNKLNDLILGFFSLCVYIFVGRLLLG